MPDNEEELDHFRVFQVVPAKVFYASSEMEYAADPATLTAYFLDGKDYPLETDLEIDGKKYAITINVRPL